jgi:hypothetical protein
MRTLGAEVVRGRWGWSAVGGRLTKPFVVGGVAVLVCCTALGPAGLAARLWPRIKGLPGDRSEGFLSVHRAGQVRGTDASELGCNS